MGLEDIMGVIAILKVKININLSTFMTRKYVLNIINTRSNIISTLYFCETIFMTYYD